MVPKIEFITIKNYKSIARVDINLEPFTVFVGPNGTGKSNFLDALAFIQQCLSQPIEEAFKTRGGIKAVKRKTIGNTKNIIFGIRLSLKKDFNAAYYVEISTDPKEEKFRIAYENCDIIDNNRKMNFLVKNGQFTREIPGIKPKIASDHLALYAASALEEFKPLYNFLTSMRFYSISPDRLRELQQPDASVYLKKDGSNVASVLKRISKEEKGNKIYDIICRLLAKVSEGLSKVEYKAAGYKETLQFIMDIGAKKSLKFDAFNMSDGTLRVLGLLIAVYQPGITSLLGIEEPESTVHPAIMELVVQVLMDASKERQILITTHSPDILDQKELSDEQIRVVSMERGKTLISRVSQSGRQSIREKLYTPGELLRIDELNPDLDSNQQETLEK